MRVVIIGLGEVGRELVRAFDEAGYDVVAIDTNAKLVDSLKDRFEVDLRVGSGTDERLMDEVEAGSAELVIAVSNNDEANIVACHIAKYQGAAKVVARAQGEDYSSSVEGIRTDFLGIDLTVNPSVLVAQELVNFARSHGAVEVLDLVRGRIDLVQVEVGGTSRTGRSYIDTSISNIPVREKGVLIAAIIRDGELIVPGGPDTLSEGDRLYLVGKRSSLREAEDLFTARRESRTKCIAGGGLTAETMARELARDGGRTLIIESDEARAKKLRELLPEESIVVATGDATDTSLLEELEVGRMDLFVAVTPSDEVNMMAALLADRLGVPRTAAVVDRPEYLEVLRSLDIDMPVSARSTASRVILRETLRRQGLFISRLEGKAEILEYFVTERSRVAGKRLGDVRLPRHALACAIYRDKVVGEGQVFIPGGKDVFEEGDRVVMLVRDDVVRDVSRLFGGVGA